MPNLSRRQMIAATGAAIALPAAAMAATTHKVSIANMAFTPAKLAVRVGDSVTWKNRDGAEHTATDKAGGWDTGTLRRNKSATVVFSKPGEYNYYCAVHPSMRGKITVT